MARSRHAPRVPLQVRTFHAELAPLADAPAGAERARDTCESLSMFKVRAGALRSVHADELLDAAAYTAAVDALEADLAALEEPCTTLNATQFEQRFASVHDDFRSVTAAIR